MAVKLPDKLNVLLLTARAGDPFVERVKALDPGRLNVVNAWPIYYDELNSEWSERTMDRLAGPRPNVPQGVEETKKELERDAHIVLGGVPYPRQMPSRAPNLIWAHFGFAGLSNLMGSDWWGTSFMTTSGRGFSGARPIAESVIAASLMHARRLDLAVLNSNPNFDATLVPAMFDVEDKTMAIIGLGGIGANVAKMARGLGMRVIATRRSATSFQKDVDGVDELYPVSQTYDVLGQADFVAVCAMWTAETEGMFDSAAFAATKPGAYFINVARGELVQEEPLVEALRSGHLGGAYLDTWPDDLARLPHPELLKLPNVTITPHVSQQAEVNHNFGVEVFFQNLQRLLKGEELVNVVDWTRGY